MICSGQTGAEPQLLPSREVFFRAGFCIIRNVFTPESLASMVQAWEAEDATARPAWESARQASRGIARHGFPPERVPEGVSLTSRKFYGFERSLWDMDVSFVDLIDTPKVLPVLKCVLTKGQGLPVLPGEEELHPQRNEKQAAPVFSNRMADIGGAREQAAYQSNFGTLRCSGAGARVCPTDRDGAGYTYWVR